MAAFCYTVVGWASFLAQRRFFSSARGLKFASLHVLNTQVVVQDSSSWVNEQNGFVILFPLFISVLSFYSGMLTEKGVRDVDCLVILWSIGLDDPGWLDRV